MDENTKLYVFSRREVALIFLFILLVALTAFVLGVRVGKGFSYDASGLAPQDRERVDLLSGEEEKVNKVVEEVKRNEEDVKGTNDKDVLDQQKIKERLEDLIKEETVKKKDNKLDKMEQSAPVNEDAPKDLTEPKEIRPSVESKSQENYSGKYTIQLGSHQSIDEANAFAEGFRIRGYDPIINEVELSNRGVWFRVSLGVFDTVTEAKNYVKKEKSLFQGQDYHFSRFD